MACTQCEAIEDVTDDGGLYVIRRCTGCGREMKLRERGKHGIGVEIRAGDRPVIPASWLTLSANPLKGNGTFTRPGLSWFAQLVFVHDLQDRRDDIQGYISALDTEYDGIFANSSLLAGSDLQDPAQADAIIEKLRANQSSPEWWLFNAGLFLSIANDSINKGNAHEAAWAMALAERYRALYIFKENFEEVVWMGHSAKRLATLLKLWDANKENGDEEFWQIQFQEHSLALSQLFSVPVTLIEGKAYVGGQKIDGRDARYVDFLFSGGAASDVMLIEIKTPVTQLMLRRNYRTNIFIPSSELSGSVVQIADYRSTLTRELSAIAQGRHNLSAFHPRCVVIIGNTKELDSENKRRSFELFRSNLSNIEVVTFDEVFKKIEHLASLFNIIRAPS